MMSRTNKSSFTLVELLVVIVIVGVLTGLSVPQFRKTIDNFSLESYTKDIYYLCHYLQATSVSTGKIQRLNIDTSNKELSAFYKGTTSFVSIPGRYGKAYKAPDSVEIALEPPQANAVNFYPDGSADKVSVVFTNKHKKQITLNIKGAGSEIKIQ